VDAHVLVRDVDDARGVGRDPDAVDVRSRRQRPVQLDRDTAFERDAEDPAIGLVDDA
jgi:hypothetical protein